MEVMSDSAINPTGSLLGHFGRYTSQALFAYPLTLLSAIPLFLLFSKLGIDGTLGSGVTFAGFAALICLYMGALIGYVVSVWIPSLVPTGRWIWVPLTLFVLGDIIPNLLRSQSAPGFLEYVYATGDNEGLAVILGTLPLSASIGYSFGVFFAKKRSPRITDESNVHHGRAFILWAASFAITSTLMVPIERSIVARHSKLAVAVRIGGTPLLLDPNGLCGPLNSGSTRKRIMLQNATKLRMLEHVDCPGGKPPLGFHKVMVIDGRNRGSEGWVLTSQVWRPLPLR